jgi:hypothetical protein
LRQVPRHLAHFEDENRRRRPRAIPPKADIDRQPIEVRLVPQADMARRSNTQPIRSHRRRVSDGGMVRPSAFAVLRLIINASFTGCCTGKSEGLAPFRIRST